MIKNLVIENFQSHKKTEINFSKGVNIFIGSSDSGKTAILRALKWLFYNRPLGDSFRSTWGGDTKVVLTLENDVVVGRIKSDNENYYFLDDTRFDACGSDVPKEIQNVLNIDEVNIQQQLDSPFLLSQTPGNVAHYFNRVCNLDSIDLCTQNIQRNIRKLTQEQQFSENKVEELQREVEKYLFLDNLEVQVVELEKNIKVLDTIVGTIKNLKSKLGAIDRINKDIEQAKPILSLEKSLDNVLVLINNKKELQNEKQELESLIEKIKEQDDLILEKKSVDIALVLVDKAIKFYKSMCEALNEKQELNSLIEKIHKQSAFLENARLEYTEYKKKWNLVFPKQCPLCGTVLKKK